MGPELRKGPNQRLIVSSRLASGWFDSICLAGWSAIWKLAPIGDEMFYFIPVDGADQDLRDTGLSTAMIAELLRDLQARRIVLILDTCQSGGAIEALSKIGSVKMQSEQRQVHPDGHDSAASRAVGIHLIAAALPLNYALGSAEGQSALAQTLLNAFRNTPGVLTVEQLSEFVREQLPVSSEHLIPGFRQVPLIASIGFDFALTGSYSAPTIPASSPHP
jgi:Caspase domain